MTNEYERSNQATWTHAKEFKEDNSRIQVHVMVQDGFRKRYSYEIGRLNPTGKLVRFFSAMAEVTNFKVKVRRLDIQILTMLIGQAEDWIEEQCQRREDEILDEKRTREEENLAREKSAGAVKPGLKTIAKADAAKRGARDD